MEPLSIPAIQNTDLFVLASSMREMLFNPSMSDLSSLSQASKQNFVIFYANFKSFCGNANYAFHETTLPVKL